MVSNAPTPVVLLTGAGGGLGQALAREFANQGWQVAAGYRTVPAQSAESRALVLRLDVADKRSIETAVQETVQKWGRLDTLVNNAGVTKDQSLTQLDLVEWDEVLEVNLKGAFRCSQAVLPFMLKQRSGHIINISSWSGRVGARGQANYAAAKAGLFGLTTALAREVGSRNIRVNAVLPGVLPTRMTAHLSEDQIAAYGAANALGRINSLEEVARFIVFLSSMQNVSGQLFQLDSRIGPWS